MHRWFVAGALAAASIVPATAVGEEPAQDVRTKGQEQERRQLEEQIAKELGQGAAATAPEPAAASAQPAAQAGTGGLGPLARLVLLPDISAIGSFAGVYDSWDAGRLSPRSGPTGPAGKPAFLFQELELGLQSVVDPYVRADVFVSFGRDGSASVEEAYATTLGLPAGLQLRAGTFFTPIGRVNSTHPHTWDFLDAPLAHDRIVSGDKLAGPGVDASWLAPLPWFAEVHLVAQSTAPFEGDPERLTGTARVSQLFALSDAATAGVGLTATRRDEGTGAFRDVAAVDLFAKYRPPAGRAYLTLQGELYARRFRGAGPADTGDGWGAYAQLFWRQGAWLGYGVRWDRAPAADPLAPASLAGGVERRWSAVGDWFATEFQRLGLQIGWDRRPDGADGWEALLHYEFIIGAHGAHPF
ncbi:MAG TPA: hypothetical protein VLT47_00525 [Anaeromyxobacteraceae bacterium]|nr:hypothetical protein [Anaeromyxobacteraceae bacterium]